MPQKQNPNQQLKLSDTAAAQIQSIHDQISVYQAEIATHQNTVKTIDQNNVAPLRTQLQQFEDQKKQLRSTIQELFRTNIMPLQAQMAQIRKADFAAQITALAAADTTTTNK